MAKLGNIEMTNVRANWLLAYEASVGSRPSQITRKEITDFMEANKGKKGPLGLTLRAPSWLTNDPNSKYNVSRGVYRMPWDELETYQEIVKNNSTGTVPNPDGYIVTDEL
jgi:hypothetical protein